MPLEYGFDKAKLPRGLSFPLGRSVLDRALEQAGVTGVHCVYYWRRQSGDVVLRAEYCGEGRKGWAAAGMSSVTVYAVPSAERKATEQAVLEQGLPRLVAWLRELERAGNTRRGVDQHLAVSYAASAVSIWAT